MSTVSSTACSGYQQRKHQNHHMGNRLVTGASPSQTASDAENWSMSWRHHAEFEFCESESWGPLLQTRIKIDPARMNNHVASKVGDDNTYPFPNFKGATAEV